MGHPTEKEDLEVKKKKKKRKMGASDWLSRARARNGGR